MHRPSNLCATALWLAFAAWAQEDAIFKADTRLVVLHASVTDKNGKLVTNIPENAFKVYENGVLQTLKIFRREDVPVSMGIIIDNSGSMRDKKAKVNAAALALVKASNKDDEVFIVNFNDDAILEQPLTNKIDMLQQALERIETKGGTAMRDAVSMSFDYLRKEGKKDKKVLVVITDGNDNTSNITLEKLVEKAHRNQEVLIYTIGILSEETPREARSAKRALTALAQASGGLGYFPQSLAEVDHIALQVAHEIRNQYILGYTPKNEALDGSFRSVKVTVQASGNPLVRTRTGYYATPGPPPKSKPFPASN
jgi:VWFA-related protein